MRWWLSNITRASGRGCCFPVSGLPNTGRGFPQTPMVSLFPPAFSIWPYLALSGPVYHSFINDPNKRGIILYILFYIYIYIPTSISVYVCFLFIKHIEKSIKKSIGFIKKRITYTPIQLFVYIYTENLYFLIDYIKKYKCL